MPTVIRTFVVGGNLYGHYLYTEDDRIELVNHERKTILIYDSHANVHDERGRVGSFHLEGKDDRWVSYHSPIRTRTVYAYTINDVEGLLDAEVEFSKMWIEKMNQRRAA